jgi:hypothetical protein
MSRPNGYLYEDLTAKSNYTGKHCFPLANMHVFFDSVQWESCRKPRAPLIPLLVYPYVCMEFSLEEACTALLRFR